MTANAPACIHWWVLDAPEGKREVDATCRKCQSQRTFKVYGVVLTWRERAAAIYRAAEEAGE